jgi:hypothetical protein
MRCKVGGIFADLSPNKLVRVEFWSTDWKVIRMQTRVPINKVLNKLVLMDGMVIPDQDNLAWNGPQNLLQENHHLFATQAAPKRTGCQPDSTIQADQQCTQQVQPLVMLQAGANGRRVPAWCPAALERRDPRKAAFIFKDQRGSQFTPLFLSLARPCVSSKQFSPRRAGSPDAAPSGCSNPSDPLHTTHHSTHSVLRTAPRSGDRSVPVSNNLLRTHGRTPRVTIPAPTAGPAHQLDASACEVGARSSALDSSLPDASDAHSVLSPRASLQPRQVFFLAQAASGRAFASFQVVHRFHRVSCPYYDTTITFSDVGY